MPMKKFKMEYECYPFFLDFLICLFCFVCFIIGFLLKNAQYMDLTSLVSCVTTVDLNGFGTQEEV